MTTPIRPTAGSRVDEGQLPAGMLAQFGTPCRSLLKSAAPARRIEMSAMKEMPAFSFSKALDHYSMFDRVQSLEAERNALKQQVDQLLREKQTLEEQQQKAETHVVQLGANYEGLGLEGAPPPSEDLNARITLLQQELHLEQAERRKIHNALVDLKGNIRVYCRVRPLQIGEAQGAVRPHPDRRSLTANVVGQDHVFTFNQVFGPTTTQQQVFGEISELVQSSLDGFNVCIFAYGQTGSGKTHTMTGSASDSERGMIPRALEKIFENVQRLKWQEWTYSLECSILEIYNDRIRDLLKPGKEISDQAAIKHDDGLTCVVGVSRVPVTGTAEALQLISTATKNRSSQGTAMNENSSRSHCVLKLSIVGQHASGTRLTGSLNMVDLAGSERLDRSQVEGQRRAEACAINQSLGALWGVFGALAGKAKHVPYRDSKLTYLLQPCLAPGGKSLMFLHVSPEQASAYETLTSLRFATKVSGVEVGPAQQRKLDPGMVSLGTAFPQELPERSKAQHQPTDQAPSAAAAGHLHGPSGRHTRSNSVNAASAPPAVLPIQRPTKPDLGATIPRESIVGEQQPAVAAEVDLRSHLKRRRQQDDTRTSGEIAPRRRKKAASAWH